MKIIILKEDITKVQCDAIVNPANSSGYMGGGVAGVIKKVGGEVIEEEAVNQAPIFIGKAVMTTAGKLPHKAVIHAPTMKRPSEITNRQNVKSATIAALECADKNGFSSIAFPGMGTGVGRVPLGVAAETMVSAIKSFKAKNLKIVYLAGISEDIVNAFRKEVV